MSRLCILFSVMLVLAGCRNPGGIIKSSSGVLVYSQPVFGYIYSHTTVPLMTDFTSTPAGNGRSSGDVKTINFYVSVEWDENGIGAIAKKHGIEEIYYADVETIRVLGYWQQRQVHIYGR